MDRSATEQSPAYQLKWTLRIVRGSQGDSVMELDYFVTAREELYVSDKLWVHDATNKRVPDPFGIYRFVRDGSLRLVFAQAPTPPNVMPRVLFTPLHSKVSAGETHHGHVEIKMPVDEYSSLSRNINVDTVVESVVRVYFVLGYRLRSTMSKAPSPPPNETAENAGYLIHDPKLIISSMEVEGLLVKRRTGYMARFALPGEPSPAPVPIP